MFCYKINNLTYHLRSIFSGLGLTVVTLMICTSLLTRQAFSQFTNSVWLSLMKTVRLVCRFEKDVQNCHHCHLSGGHEDHVL